MPANGRRDLIRRLKFTVIVTYMIDEIVTINLKSANSANIAMELH